MAFDPNVFNNGFDGGFGFFNIDHLPPLAAPAAGLAP